VCALAHEQSVAGALFTVMSQVRIDVAPLPYLSPSLPIQSPCLVVTALG
jgi:hypothetical protein